MWKKNLKEKTIFKGLRKVLSYIMIQLYFVLYNYVVIGKLIKKYHSSFSKSKEISHAYNIECFW